MLTYRPHDGSYGSLAQALDEARAMVRSLEDAEHTKAIFEAFPETVSGLYAPRGDRILFDTYEDNGELRIVAREGGE